MKRTKPASVASKKRRRTPRELAAHHRAEALGKLEITETDVEAELAIGHITRAAGPTGRLVEFLAGASAPEARAVVLKAKLLTPAQLAACPIEALCAAARIPSRRVLEVLMSAVAEQSQLASKLMSKAAHPRVVQATVDAALLPDGTGDRKMLHLAEGFVPVPKTQVTFNRTDSRDQSTHNTVAILRPLDESVKRLTDRFIDAAPVAVLPEEESHADEEDAVHGDD